MATLSCYYFRMSVISDLKATRLAQKRTVRDVAKQAGLHENIIRNAEQGRTSPPLSTLERWAAALGLRPVLIVEVATKKVA